MKMNEVAVSADELDPKNRKATIKLIDLKVEDDMEKVLNKIHHEFSLLNSRFERIDSRFEQIAEKFQHVDSRFSTVYWVLGLSTAFLAVLLTILGIMISIR